MSDNGTGTSDEAGGAPSEGGTENRPHYRVITQYIKDLSFESPRPPAQLPHEIEAPDINVSVNVNTRTLDAEQTRFEVELGLDTKAVKDGEIVFIVEVVYAAILELTNVPNEVIHPLTMVEGPRLIFPYARRIVSDVVRDGGFPPLLLEPIDFNALYRQHMQQNAPANQGEPAAADT